MLYFWKRVKFLFTNILKDMQSWQGIFYTWHRRKRLYNALMLIHEKL